MSSLIFFNHTKSNARIFTCSHKLYNLSFSSDQPAIPFCAIISVPSYPDKKFVSTECLLLITESVT